MNRINKMKSAVLAIGVAVAGCIGSYGQDAQESRKITERDIVRALDGNVSAQKDTLSSTQLWENAFILLGASAEWINRIKSEPVVTDPGSLENNAREATMTFVREDFETLPDSVKLNALHDILSASHWLMSKIPSNIVISGISLAVSVEEMKRKRTRA